MELDRSLTRRADIDLPCDDCRTVTPHRRYCNSRHELFLCSACATLTTSAGRGPVPSAEEN
jgi:hypothetical protein